MCVCFKFFYIYFGGRKEENLKIVHIHVTLIYFNFFVCLLTFYSTESHLFQKCSQFAHTSNFSSEKQI